MAKRKYLINRECIVKLILSEIVVSAVFTVGLSLVIYQRQRIRY